MSRWLRGEVVRVGRRPGFLGAPTYRFQNGGRFEIGPAGSGWIVEIPPTFVFDNSAPWWLAWLLPRKKMRRATGLHDFGRTDPTWSLWFGDLLFTDAMEADGVEEPMLTFCWWAVRTNNNRRPIEGNALR